MSTSPFTIEGTLRADGRTVHLDKQLELPPGRVTVTVTPTPRPSGLPLVEVLDRIHRDQQRRGRQPMTEEEMAADLARRRAEDEQEEQRWRAIWAQSRSTPGEGSAS